MRTTSTSKNSWTTRRTPSSSDKMTSPPLQSATASSTLKSRSRRHFAECRTSGGRRGPTKSKPILPQRIQNCSSAPPRKCTALPIHAPRRSCQLTAQPCLKSKVEGTLQYSAQRTLHCGPHCARPEPTEARDHQPRPPPNDR